MHGIKKFLLVGMIGLIGILLTLAGLNLLQMSSSLVLYSGVGLLGIAALYYFLY